MQHLKMYPWVNKPPTGRVCVTVKPLASPTWMCRLIRDWQIRDILTVSISWCVCDVAWHCRLIFLGKSLGREDGIVSFMPESTDSFAFLDTAVSRSLCRLSSSVDRATTCLFPPPKMNPCCPFCRQGCLCLATAEILSRPFGLVVGMETQRPKESKVMWFLRLVGKRQCQFFLRVECVALKHWLIRMSG